MNRGREWLVLACLFAVSMMAGALWVRDWQPYAQALVRSPAPGAGLDAFGWHLRVASVSQASEVSGTLAGAPFTARPTPGFVYVLVQLDYRIEEGAGSHCELRLRTRDGALHPQADSSVTNRYWCENPGEGTHWLLYELPPRRVPDVVGLDVESWLGREHIVLRPPA